MEKLMNHFCKLNEYSWYAVAGVSLQQQPIIDKDAAYMIGGSDLGSML